MCVNAPVHKTTLLRYKTLFRAKSRAKNGYKYKYPNLGGEGEEGALSVAREASPPPVSLVSDLSVGVSVHRECQRIAVVDVSALTRGISRSRKRGKSPKEIKRTEP